MPGLFYGQTQQWKVQIANLRQETEAAEKAVQDLEGEPVLRAFRDASLYVLGTARQEAKVDRGLWRASLAPFLETSQYGGNVIIKAGVGSNLSYGPWADLDTKPHWPPVAALVAWVHRKRLAGNYSTKSHARLAPKYKWGKRWRSAGAMGIYQEDLKVAWAIARKISKQGTKGDHALEKGLQKNMDKIVARLKKGVNEALVAAGYQ